MSNIPRTSLCGSACLAVAAMVVLTPSGHVMATGPAGDIPSNHTHQDQPLRSPRKRPFHVGDRDNPADIFNALGRGYTTSTHTHQDDDPEDPTGGSAPPMVDRFSPEVTDDHGISHIDFPGGFSGTPHTVQESTFDSPIGIDIIGSPIGIDFYTPINLEPIVGDFLIATPDDFVNATSVHDITSDGVSIPGSIPTPGALPLLLVGALAGRRRRRH